MPPSTTADTQNTLDHSALQSHNKIIPVVIFTEDAAAALAKLPKPIKARIAEMIARLAKWPEVSGAKPLAGKLAGHYRLRTGDYRLQFHIEGKAVVIEQIGHRDGFYEG